MPKAKKTRSDPEIVEYISGKEELLDRVGPMWERLNEQHAGLQKDFPEYYKARTYERRRKEFMEHSKGGKLFVDIAINKGNGHDLGYCVATMYADGEGEIESIYIEPEYRRKGIGDHMMKMAFKRFEEEGAAPITLILAAGNEGVMGFYRKYGFAPKYIGLQRKD